MTNTELEAIADHIHDDFPKLRSDRIAGHIKLLRSIEISALREARELVEKQGDDDGLGVQDILSALTRKITHLELRQ